MAGCSYEYEENGQRCTLSFTASCGLAEFTGDELLRRADEALYVAKRTGKNRVVLAKKSKSWWKTLKPFKCAKDTRVRINAPRAASLF
jgi:predicted signal transduction protein with EAL and GGDEF domain